MRRLGAYFLEVGLVLITLVVGYLIWLLIVMARGQTPGKQLLGLVVVHPDGTPFGWGGYVSAVAVPVSILSPHIRGRHYS